MKATLLFILIFLMGNSALSYDDTAMNNYDALHYDINIKFDIQNKLIHGFIQLTIKPLRPIDSIFLSATKATINVDSIFIINDKTKFQHLPNHLSIDLKKTYTDTIQLKIYYKAYSDFMGEFNNGGVYFDLRGSYPKIATSSQPFFTRKWLPSKDVPYDKVTTTINITTPDSLTAVSNGILISVLENSDQTKTFIWKSTYPIAPYLIAFAVGKYEFIQDEYISISNLNLPISYYIFPEYIQKAKDDFSNTKKMLKFMEEYFGEYPFIKEKYGIALVPGELMMENQTITFIEEDLITGRGDVEQFLIHELAHQWFGNLITPKSWHHLWLSEGFANYIQALYYEYYLGKKWYHHIINSYMDREPGTYAGPLVGKSDTSFNDIFSERIYFKGAIVLHMLRYLVGDSTFFKILKTYVTNPEYKYSNVTTEDFIEVCENIYMDDLSWFFEQWVYSDQDTIDRPIIAIDWKKEKIYNGYKISIQLKQLTTDIYNYTLPIELSIVTSTDTIDYKIMITEPVSNFIFEVKDEPFNIILDKNNWIFKKVIYGQK